MGFFVPILATSLPYLVSFGRLYRTINQRITRNVGPLGYGVLYSGGTVIGYHSASSLYSNQKKFKYVGHPQRLKRL